MKSRAKASIALFLSLFLLAALLPLTGCGASRSGEATAPGEIDTPAAAIPTPPPVVSEPVQTASVPLNCTHARHDPETVLCQECGEKCWHKYRDGSCIGCGAELVFSSGSLDACYYEELPEDQQGTCEMIRIPFRGAEIPAMVYLPCGYETGERKYPVMVLLPTINGPCQGAMTAARYAEGRSFSMKNIYDTMFQKGDCESVIIVSLNYISDFGLMRRVLREAVFPYLAEHYRTFAESGDPADLAAARSAFALGGTSNGALQTCYSGLEHMSDLCANFAVLAGAIDHEEIADALNGDFAAYPPDTVFIAYGENDRWARRAAEPLYQTLAEDVESCRPGSNLWLNVMPGMDHNWAAFSLEIYDALRVCFPNT